MSTLYSGLGYDISIGSGLLKTVGETVRSLGFSRVFLVTDANVAPLYSHTVTESVADMTVGDTFIAPAGEDCKTPDVYFTLLEYMAEAELCRTDAVVALGGGTVGDLAGFAAATYMRGIPVIQLPTTLLAAVDSSIGGKTGINLGGRKNAVGAFHRPSAVICDTDTFKTLPPRELLSGAGEVIKYAVLAGGPLLSLVRGGACLASENVVYTCAMLKCGYVKSDEFDRGTRALLNLGHTAAHAVERVSRETVPHGEAVAVGIAAAARFAVSEGLSDSADYIFEILDKYCIPATLGGLCAKYGVKTDADALADAALADKKRDGNEISLVLPVRPGDVRVVRYPTGALTRFFGGAL